MRGEISAQYFHIVTSIAINPYYNTTNPLVNVKLFQINIVLNEKSHIDIGKKNITTYKQIVANQI